MKAFAFICAALAATPSFAVDFPATEFNGNSVTISVASTTKINAATVPQGAVDAANAICGSVDKTASLQSLTQIADFRYLAFFLCL